MKRNLGTVLLVTGIICVILSTAYLVHYAKSEARRKAESFVEEYRAWQRGLGIQRVDEEKSTNTIAYAFLFFGIALAMIGIVISASQRSDRRTNFAVSREYFGKQMVGFMIARIVASVLLIWALMKHPYDYYTLLRFVVCGATAYGTYLAVRFKQITWAWIFGIVAVLFNPIFPIHLARGTWAIIDVCVAVLLMASIFVFRELKAVE